MGERLEYIYNQRIYTKASKNMKRCSKLVVIRKLEVKATMSSHCISSTMATCKDQNDPVSWSSVP